MTKLLVFEHATQVTCEGKWDVGLRLLSCLSNNVGLYYIKGPNTSSTEEDFQEFLLVQQETSSLKTN